MKTISDLPNEIILQIFIELPFVTGDVFNLSRSSKRFRRLFFEHERSIAKNLASRWLPVSSKVFEFSQGITNIKRLTVLAIQTSEVAALVSWCGNMRQVVLENNPQNWRPVWYTALWQEHLRLGLLVFMRLALDGPQKRSLEMLPKPFHAILRFTSIVVTDMMRARCAVILGDDKLEHTQAYWRSGRAPGDTAPWIWPIEDLTWRSMEILLFEHGWKPFLKMMICVDPNAWGRRVNPRGETVMSLLCSGRLPPDRHYHLRLDELCIACGGVWGGPNFWQRFDPFGLRGTGLAGRKAMLKMLEQWIDS
jgi:F-box domain